MYDIKALYEAASVEDAIALLTAHPDAKIIAGGSDVLIKLREGKLAGCELVSIYKIDALRGISMEPDGTIRIRPLTSFSHITRDPIIQEHVN
ncbi:MAG: FAD binding domain-containing protein, partial [Clostridia bacterium]|nr:FAD binding domain-containing protein [Clostridia bacterium]